MNKLSRTICKALIAVGGICAFNYLYHQYAVKKKLLHSRPEDYFTWRGLRVYYHRAGSGSPVILLHRPSPELSSYEWSRIEQDLAKHHTVYSIDLPGCGRSAKPEILYTNFFFTSMLKHFITVMSIEGAAVITSGCSSVIAMMCEAYEPGSIGKMIFINPPSASEMAQIPDRRSKLLSGLYQLPLIGPLIYNIHYSRQAIDLSLTEKYLYNPFHDNEKMVDIFFESAHLGHGFGAWLESSIVGNYLNINIEYAAKHLDVPVRIIEGKDMDSSVKAAEEWTGLNTSIQVSRISHSRYFPHIEEPECTLEEIESFL